jgi:hypothetical protein
VSVRDFSTAQSNLLGSWIDARGFGRAERCKRHSEAVLNWVVRNHIGTVILAGRPAGDTMTGTLLPAGEASIPVWPVAQR